MAELEKLINKINSRKGSENFPVGSVFIQKKLRKVVKAYYNFARTADNIADNKILSTDEKLEILNTFDGILKGNVTQEISCVNNLIAAIEKQDLNTVNAYELLIAFKWDSLGKEYDHWEDLITYCRYSAAPVGRFMLDLHKETYLLYTYSDALCSALQILNHIQDIKEDFIKLDRIYVPKSFMIKFKVNMEELGAARCSPALRLLINKMLHNVESLLLESRKLPRLIRNKRLKLEVFIILNLAFILLNKLKKNDPLKRKIKLNKLNWLRAIFKAILQAIIY